MILSKNAAGTSKNLSSLIFFFLLVSFTGFSFFTLFFKNYFREGPTVQTQTMQDRAYLASVKRHLKNNSGVQRKIDEIIDQLKFSDELKPVDCKFLAYLAKYIHNPAVSNILAQMAEKYSPP